jgi:hypothetical protein
MRFLKIRQWDKVIKHCLESFCSGNFGNFYTELRKPHNTIWDLNRTKIIFKITDFFNLAHAPMPGMIIKISNNNIGFDNLG